MKTPANVDELMALIVPVFNAHDSDLMPGQWGAENLLRRLREAGLAIVPVDDVTRPFCCPVIPEQMVVAGMEQIGRAEDDMRNYVACETIDWDSGMIAVAVYRAMVSEGRVDGGKA